MKSPKIAAGILWAGMLASSAVAPAADAQEISASPIMKVHFSIAPTAWQEEATGQKHLQAALSFAGRTCATPAKEFYRWDAASPSDAATIEKNVNAALDGRGWYLKPNGTAPDGGHVSVASRLGPNDIVVDWVPMDGSIGLALCVAEPFGY